MAYISTNERNPFYFMRTITTHESDFCSFTANAAHMCQILNEYKRQHPECTFNDMRKWYEQTTNNWLSNTTIARYYYGCHHLNASSMGRFINHARVRMGAQVSI